MVWRPRLLYVMFNSRKTPLLLPVPSSPSLALVKLSNHGYFRSLLTSSKVSFTSTVVDTIQRISIRSLLHERATIGHRQDSLYCALQALPVSSGIAYAGPSNSVARLFSAHSFTSSSLNLKTSNLDHTRLFGQNSPFGSFAFPQNNSHPSPCSVVLTTLAAQALNRRLSLSLTQVDVRLRTFHHSLTVLQKHLF